MPQERHLKRPLFMAGCAYLAGTAAALLLPRNILVVATAIFLTAGLLCLIMKARGEGLVFLCLATALTSFLLYQHMVYEPLAKMQGNVEEVAGRVDEVEVRDYGTRYKVFGAVGGHKTGITLYTYSEPEAEKGDSISCQARIQMAEKSWELGKGDFVHAFSQSQIKINDPKAAGMLDRLRADLIKKSDGLYIAPIRGLMQGMLFGYTGNMEPTFNTMFSLSGAAHILSVSGLHVSIVAHFAMGLLQAMGMRRRLAHGLPIPLIWIFVALAGFSPSATRAGIMTTVCCLAEVLRRSYDALTALGFSGLCLVVANPYNIMNIGFLLSFAATLGILLYSGVIANFITSFALISRLAPPEAKLRQGMISTCAISLAILPFSLPILLLCFNTVPLLAPLTSILILWPVGPVLLLGFASLLFSYIPFLSVLAEGSAFLAGLLCRWILLAAKFVSDFPLASHDSRSFTLLAWSLIFCAACLFCLFYSKNSQEEKSGLNPGSSRTHAQRKKLTACVMLACLNLLLISTAFEKCLRVNLLEITATENTLVLTRSGHGLLVGQTESDYEAEQVGEILRSAGVVSSGDNPAAVGTGAQKLDGSPPTPFTATALGGIKLRTVERTSLAGLRRYDLMIDCPTPYGIKTVCKTSRKYDILNDSGGSTALFDGDNTAFLLSDWQGLSKTKNTAGETVVKIRLK